MKEIVLSRFRKEAYNAAYAWCNMRETKDEELKEAMEDSWRRHREGKWVCWELLEEFGVSKDELWAIEDEATRQAHDFYNGTVKK